MGDDKLMFISLLPVQGLEADRVTYYNLLASYARRATVDKDRWAVFSAVQCAPFLCFPRVFSISHTTIRDLDC